MAYSPNPQQFAAITDFTADLLVSAGAGTGKTSVLSKKFLELLASRSAGIKEIVAITFTNKAAAEMRSRIQSGIEDKLVEAEEVAERQYWQEQLELVEQARVSTFHSLCLGMIKEHPLEAGIQPGSDILDQGEGALCLDKLITQTFLDWESVAPETGGQFYQLLEAYGWEALQNIFRTAYLQVRESGKSFKEIMELTADRLGQFSDQQRQRSLEQLIELVEEFLREAAQEQLTASAQEKLALFNADWPGLKVQLKQRENWDELLAPLDQVTKMMPGNLPKSIKEPVAEVRQAADELRLRLINQQFRLLLPVFEVGLIKIDQAYQSLKLEAGLVDFTDQQLLAKKMLQDHPMLLEQLRRGIKYIMVDEFQDTNSVQLELIKLLVGADYQAGRWMAVGDVKQSIYGFRGAEAGLIVQLRQDFEQQGSHIVALKTNYRSSPAVINYVNAVFSEIFRDESFPYEPLEAYQSEDKGAVEFLLSVENGACAEMQLQAELTAARIQRLVKEGYQYNEIVLLFRVINSMVYFQKAFQRLGIPYNMAGGSNFYQRPEIIDQLNLLRLVECSQDSLALLAMLKSPYVGLSETSLLKLGKGSELSGIFAGNAPLEGELPVAELKRVRRFQEVIRYLQANREALTIPDLFRYALRNLAYQELCWIFEDGEQRLANLEKLLSLAESFSVKGYHSISGFLDYLQEIFSSGVLESNAPTQGEFNQAVRMMTIHRSKGLEFPVVIIPDLNRSFGVGHHPRVHFHKNIGIACKLPDGAGELLEPATWDQIKELEKGEELAESKRLLYVAMTRAQKRLILVGSDGKQVKSGDTLATVNTWMKWFQIIHPFPEEEGELYFKGIRLQVLRNLEAKLAETTGATLLEESLQQLSRGKLPEADFGIPPLLPREFVLKVTEFLSYQDCPRRFFYQTCYGLPEADVQLEVESSSGDGLGAEIGNFLHEGAETHSLEWPEELWQKFLMGKSIADPQLLRKEVEQMWNNYITSEYAIAAEFWDELPFVLRITPKLRLEGRFDRLLANDNGELVLVDYKTHRIQGEQVTEVAKRYFAQLQLYALAVRELWGHLPDRAELFFVYPGCKVSVPLEESALIEVLEELQTLSSRLNNCHDPEVYPVKSNCKGCCGFAWVCKQ